MLSGRSLWSPQLQLDVPGCCGMRRLATSTGSGLQLSLSRLSYLFLQALDSPPGKCWINCVSNRRMKLAPFTTTCLAAMRDGRDGRSCFWQVIPKLVATQIVLFE